MLCLRSTSPPRAFGLAEILVCIGVLVPVVTVAVGIFPYGWLVNRQASAVLFARDLGAAQIAAARAADFDGIAPHTASTAVDARGNTYSVTVDVTPAIATSPVTLKKVTIVVTWVDRVPQRLDLATLLVRTARRH